MPRKKESKSELPDPESYDHSGSWVFGRKDNSNNPWVFGNGRSVAAFENVGRPFEKIPKGGILFGERDAGPEKRTMKKLPPRKKSETDW